MAHFQTTLSAALTEFVSQAPIFFVASAANTGRVNCSPKGTDSLRVLNDRTVAYLDFTGSGNETSAHIFNDGRLTMMLCSFGAKPLILRLYGRGEVVQPGDVKWDELIANFAPAAGQRQIIVLHIESVQTSCGFGVPRMDFDEHRQDLAAWASKKSEEELSEYRLKKNTRSIDGLPTGLNPSPAGS